MDKRIFALAAFLLAVISAAAQVSDTSAANANSGQMLMPPPISAVGFPAETAGEERANYWSGSLAFSGGYVNNLYAGNSTTTVNDALYVVQPSISFDHTAHRSHEMLTYSPGFTFYDPDNTLNTSNQAGTAALQFRITPHINFLAGDTGSKTSNAWSQPLASGSVSGGLPVASPGIVAPFANQVANSGYAQLSWQFSRDDMLGFDGTTTLLSYADNSEAQGLYNSTSKGGSAFYTHRLTSKQYFGGAYEYSMVAGTPVARNRTPEADLEADTLIGFYTAYLRPTLTLSLGGGSQYYKVTQAGILPVTAWSPSALGSLGWQGLRTSLALSVSHVVTEGNGVIGAYKTDSASLSGRWRASRNWMMNLGGGYSDLSAVDRAIAGSLPGGHTLSGMASIGRQLGQNLSFSVQYQRLHQDYAGIPAISGDPNSSFESGSITYHFSRPLGR